MKERIWSVWARARPVLANAGRRLVRMLGLYLDDLLLIAGGGCFVRAALHLAGRDWAVAVAGVCLVAYAWVVAKSRRGGGR